MRGLIILQSRLRAAESVLSESESILKYRYEEDEKVSLDFDKLDGIIGEEQENIQEQYSEQLQQVQNSLKPQYMESERTEEILREYQESRMRASQGMTNIVMGSAYGESLYALLIQAVEVIDNLVNDGGVFADTVKKNLQRVSDQAVQTALANDYGYVTEPQKAELSASKARLENLQRALIGACGDNRTRIESAIREHTSKIRFLENAIGSTSRDEKNHVV